MRNCNLLNFQAHSVAAGGEPLAGDDVALGGVRFQPMTLDENLENV